MTDTPLAGGRPSPDLRIVETRVYRGANVWAYDKSIHLVVDLGSLEQFPTNTIPGFTDNLLQLLPEHIPARAIAAVRPIPVVAGVLDEVGAARGHRVAHLADVLEAAGNKLANGR